MPTPSRNVLRDAPGSRPRGVTAALHDTVVWFDDYFPAEAVTLRNNRCLAREGSLTEQTEGMGYRKVNAFLHARPNSCRQGFRMHLFSLLRIAIEDNGFWYNQKLSLDLARGPDRELIAFTTYAVERFTKNPREHGLEADLNISWQTTFASPQELGTYLDCIRGVGAGVMSVRDGCNELILRPAATAGELGSLPLSGPTTN